MAKTICLSPFESIDGLAFGEFDPSSCGWKTWFLVLPPEP